jgi:hypothetical protein
MGSYQTLPDEEIARIEEIATEAGILVHTEMDATIEKQNLMVVTGRTDQNVGEVLIPELGKDTQLRDQYLILSVVGQGESDRAYTRTAIVTYEASGVLVNVADINMLNVIEVVNRITNKLEELQGILPGPAMKHLLLDEDRKKQYLDYLSDSRIMHKSPCTMIVGAS